MRLNRKRPLSLALAYLCLTFVGFGQYGNAEPVPSQQLKVARLIKRLGHRDYSVRAEATKQLAKMGEVIRQDLEKTRKTHRDAEVKQRAAQLLRHLDGLERKRLQKLAGTADLYAVGLYRNKGGGVVEVEVNVKNKPIILVLTAYDSMRWKVKAVKGAQIVKVILGGYQQQHVEGVNAIVESYSYNPRVQGQKYRLNYAYTTSNSTYKRYEQTLRQITGRPITQFIGERYFMGRKFVFGPKSK